MPEASIDRAVLRMNAYNIPDLVDVQLSEPLLTADQVAALLAVPRSSVYEYARRRHRPLPSIAVGRHRRFYRSDVEAWLAGQRGARLPGVA
jgi:excisionase family DNA binding protein